MFRTMIYNHLGLYKYFHKKFEKKINSAKYGGRWRKDKILPNGCNSLQTIAKTAGRIGAKKATVTNDYTIFNSYLKVDFDL